MIEIAIIVLFYPLLVLAVALTGPHHPVEKVEIARLKARRRRQ